MCIVLHIAQLWLPISQQMRRILLAIRLNANEKIYHILDYLRFSTYNY